MSSGTDLTQKYEEERLRTQEQTQIVHLQGQIDELRRLIRDQTNKYHWSMEQVRKNEATIAQVGSSFEHHTRDVAQLVDRSRRDVLDLRKEVAGALVKMQESVEPIRQIQAQIQQLADAARQDRDQIAPWLVRIEEVEEKIAPLYAQIRETDERHRQLANQLNQLRDADAEALKQVRRVSEDIQVEKQSLRRQAVEAQQLVGDVRGILEEHESRIARIDEIRQHVDTFASSIPEQINELYERLPGIDTEIKRIERISTERFLMNQERLEDLRVQNDEKVAELQEVEIQHTYQHNAWLERIDSLIIELDQRINRNYTELVDKQEYQKDILAGLEEREIKVIAALSEIFQKQVEVVSQGQVETRRAAQEALES